MSEEFSDEIEESTSVSDSITLEATVETTNTAVKSGATLVSNFCRKCGSHMKLVEVIDGEIECPHCHNKMKW